jgi:hypothetical protein
MFITLTLGQKYKIFADKTDDCQSAYQMYQCGKERAPTVFGKMVVYQEETSKMANNTALSNCTYAGDLIFFLGSITGGNHSSQIMLF